MPSLGETCTVLSRICVFGHDSWYSISREVVRSGKNTWNRETRETSDFWEENSSAQEWGEESQRDSLERRGKGIIWGLRAIDRRRSKWVRFLRGSFVLRGVTMQGWGGKKAEKERHGKDGKLWWSAFGEILKRWAYNNISALRGRSRKCATGFA